MIYPPTGEPLPTRPDIYAVMEILEQFYPETFEPEDIGEFSKWWDSLDEDLKQEARERVGPDCMVADLVAYGRGMAWRNMYAAHVGYNLYMDRYRKQRDKNIALEASNKWLTEELSRELKRRATHEDRSVQAADGNDGVRQGALQDRTAGGDASEHAAQD